MQFIAWLFLLVQAAIVIASLLGYGIFIHGPICWSRLIRKRGFSLGPLTASPLAICSLVDWLWWQSQFYVIAGARSWPYPLSM